MGDIMMTSYIDKEDIELKIRATYYPGAKGANVLLNGRKFVLDCGRSKPLV